MSLKGKHRYHALWSVKRINRKGILFLVKPSEQSVWVKTQLEQIHPFRWTYRQTRCAEISAQWHLCQNQYGNFPSTAGCPPMLMRQNLLRTKVFCWPFLASWEFFDLRKIIFCGPFYHCFKFPTLLACLTIFLTFHDPFVPNVRQNFWCNHPFAPLKSPIASCMHHPIAQDACWKFQCKGRFAPNMFMKVFFFSLAMKTFGHGEHLLIKFGQKWEVTNCTIADFIL